MKKSGKLINQHAFNFLGIRTVKIKSEGGGIVNVPPGGISINTVLRELIESTLEMTSENQVKAAKILGISRGKLIYRIKKLGINAS